MLTPVNINVNIYSASSQKKRLYRHTSETSMYMLYMWSPCCAVCTAGRLGDVDETLSRQHRSETKHGQTAVGIRVLR